MALKNILVVVDDTESTATRLSYAARLAERHEAHLAGVFVTPPLDTPAYVMAQVPAAVRKAQTEAAERKADEVRTAFEQVMSKGGLSDRAEWRRQDGEPTTTVALMGRYADLIVVGQTPPEAPATAIVDPAELTLAGGRPVLVVPYSFRPTGVGEHVLVAWNGSREAARAVADAMPILEAADRVSVLSIDPGRDLGDEPGADIAAHLAHHGIDVEAMHMVSHGLDPADALLNRASDLSADMIVMGAYGRSRLRELVLGGVTRGILRHMTVPVLMAH